MVRVTLREVADRAGVSLATASKVMNGRGDVKDTTRELVRSVAAEVNYEPRRRDAQDRRSLVIVFESLDSVYALEVLQGAVLAARRAGVDLSVCTCEEAGDDPAPLTREWFRASADAGRLGVIAVTTPITMGHLEWSRACSLPLIVIDPAKVDPGLTALSGVVRISATNWAGGKLATEHLLELGHRRIGVVMGRETSIPLRERFEGYRTALEQAGIPFDPTLVVGDDYGFDEGRSVGHELLGAEDPPSAIFATSDALGLGVLRAAYEMGVAVPDELSVVGFDGTAMASVSNPQLTAISQPLFSMGQVAVERAMALAGDPDLFAHPFQLETHLVVRESTGAGPARG